MNRSALLACSAIPLALLPLQSTILSNQFLSGLPLHDWEVLAGIAILVFFAVVTVRTRPGLSQFGVRMCLFISAVIILLSVVGTIQPINTASLLRLLIMFWTFPVFISILRDPRMRSVFIFTCIGVIALHAQWGIAQFVIQDNMGLQIIGEAPIHPDQLGIAKFLLGTQKLIRAYGPHPHPNSFAAVLVIGFVLCLAGLNPRSRRAPQTFLVATAYTIFLALLLTFSRSGLVAASLALAISLWRLRSSVALSLRNALPRVAMPILLTYLTLLPLTLARAVDPQDQAIPDRLSGFQWYRALISELPFWRGFGPGNYPAALSAYLEENEIPHETWQIEPVHSVPLLLQAEWGILGVLALLTIVAFPLIRSAPHAARLQTRNLFLLLPLAPLAAFDHYLLTQAAPLVWAAVLTSVLLTPAATLSARAKPLIRAKQLYSG